MSFTLTNKKPDILTCLANLSSDEVFTPPKVANAMLDLLPQKLFRNPFAKFLDPACKSGVFLREIVKRLIAGLEDNIPDLQARVNHIMRYQVYGIALTDLTAKVSRRTVYCSMNVRSEFSVCRFDDDEGRVRFRECGHDFVNGKCRYCGVRQKGDSKEESYAYEFIHTDKPEDIWSMKFDVVISNPPYQMSDGGFGASARPIYQEFVNQAKKLNPKYIVMIIPARWYAGGKGLDKFREEMLNDRRIRVLHDFGVSEDLFPGIRISGGVCYFKWDRDNPGDCEIVNHSVDRVTSQMTRPLLEKEAETFIRINEAIPILRKVQAFNEKSFADIVSARKPFGLPSDFFASPSKYGLPPVSDTPITDGITITGLAKYKRVDRYVARDYPFPAGQERLTQYKVYVSQVLDNGFDWQKERLRPFLGKPYTACTETFLCVGGYDDEQTAQNVISYMNTKFFHMLLFLKKVSHHVVAKVYEFVPVQDFSRSWTDDDLYAKYSLTPEEIEFIETHIKPLEDSRNAS